MQSSAIAVQLQSVLSYGHRRFSFT